MEPREPLPAPGQPPEPGSTQPPARRRSPWMYVGIGLAVVLVLAGLAVVAFLLLFFVGMSNWSSNK
jgi:hypothetical protein